MTDGQVFFLIVGYLYGIVGMLRFMDAFEDASPLLCATFALLWPIVVPLVGLGAVGGAVFTFLFESDRQG